MDLVYSARVAVFRVTFDTLGAGRIYNVMVVTHERVNRMSLKHLFGTKNPNTKHGCFMSRVLSKNVPEMTGIRIFRDGMGWGNTIIIEHHFKV